MQQSYAAICLISTRKVPRHGLDFRVTARLKSQWKGLLAPGIEFSNFETNYLVFSNTSPTKRLRR